MERAKAQDRLENLQLVVYPHAKKDSAAKIHKNLVSDATPKEERKKRAIKTSDLSGIFGGDISDYIKAKNGR